eukprot:TRINITY_DN18275_c0_g1_i1.p1 TRINITY_DN18275_c0_g1~~TRINITY_DN18275_c0_g1_i1.p1  ORF type:complete len:108 (+),score=34.38 TRINITY_DN18275_c0_g1_i1:91-414(+)
MYYFYFFFNDTATTEIYTRSIVGSVRCVQETGLICVLCLKEILEEEKQKIYSKCLHFVHKLCLDEKERKQFPKLCWVCEEKKIFKSCLLYTSPSPRDLSTSRMPSSA